MTNPLRTLFDTPRRSLLALHSSLLTAFNTWALRGRPPEPTPIVLSQRRVFVLPTRAGLAFAVSLAVMLVGAINYGLSLGYALVFLLGGLGISTILATFRNLAHLRIALGHCAPVFAGETAHFGLVLHNARSAERLSLRLAAGGNAAVVIGLPANDSMQVLLPVPAKKRGWLTLPRVTLETTYPLGLVRAWAYAAPEQHCLVYPAPAAAAPPLPFSEGEQIGSQRRSGGSDDFAGLRQHQTADPPRHIAWKVVARQGDEQLITKLFAGESAQSLILDWNALPANLGIETKIRILARWICDAHAAGLAYGMRLPGRSFDPASGDGHFHRCLQALALDV